MEDVHRLEIPTPFQIGRVNCYCFETHALTLLDPGPASDDAYDVLSAELSDRGHAIADVERILISHPHMDHFGIANRIAVESGADVLAHPHAADRMADPDGLLEREQTLFEPFLREMGVPAETAESVVGLPAPYADFQDAVPTDRTLSDGDAVDLGSIELVARHTPGHAPGSICLVERERGVVFTGDHLMMEISPNPLLTVRPDDSRSRTRSLPTYLESLERLRSFDADTGYAGHRGTVTDVETRIDETVAHHRDRKEHIASILDETGPRTAYELMGELFPDLPVTEVFPGMSEVVGHLDLLEDEGRVELRDGRYRLQ